MVAGIAANKPKAVVYSWTVILSKKKILLDSKRDIKNFSAYFSIDKTLDELQSQIPSSGTMADIFSSGYKEFTCLELDDKQANANTNTIIDTSTINNSNVIHLFSPLSSVEYRKA
jgi:biopolymer transport protein TolQ